MILLTQLKVRTSSRSEVRNRKTGSLKLAILSYARIVVKCTARYFLSPNSKKKKPSAYSEGEEYKDSEDEYDEYEPTEDELREDYEEYDLNDSDDGDELDEKEKINYKPAL